ncbi:MAG TPA: hypothetical protein VGN33_09435 [Leifsonia sp.]|jgi:hypothetical protein|nr:hypothetical protein [Leifsonia sp.]
MVLNLTDDEVIAVANTLEIEWPFALPSVTAQELVPASLRGVRSLVARELAEMDRGGVTIDDTVREPIEAMANGDQYAVSYMALDSNPLALVGSSTYMWGHDAVVVDMVTAGGLHSLLSTSRDAGIKVLVATVENVFRLGYRESPSVADHAALYSFSSANDGGRVLRTVRGRLDFGRFEHAADSRGTVFVVDDTVTTFAFDRVTGLFFD